MVMMRDFVFEIIKNRIQRFYTIPNRLAIILAIDSIHFACFSFGLLRNQLYPVENFLDAFY